MALCIPIPFENLE